MYLGWQLEKQIARHVKIIEIVILNSVVLVASVILLVLRIITNNTIKTYKSNPMLLNWK